MDLNLRVETCIVDAHIILIGFRAKIIRFLTLQVTQVARSQISQASLFSCVQYIGLYSANVSLLYTLC